MDVKQAFLQRFSQLLAQRRGNQAELAKKLHCSAATLTRWKDGSSEPGLDNLAKIAAHFGTTTDWLLGSDVSDHRESEWKGFRWIAFIPPYIEGRGRLLIEEGIRFFRSTFIKQMGTGQLRDQNPAFDMPRAYEALFSALRSGSLCMTHVPTNEELAEQLLVAFPHLHRACVHVVDLPYRFVGTPIYAEFVAFTAATKALPSLHHPYIVGLGGGYTIYRMAELSSPGQFVGVKWLPLSNHAENIGRNNFRSPNQAAMMMAVRNPRSEALYLAHAANILSDTIREINQNTLRAADNMDAVFITVNGPERDFRPVDYSERGTTYDLYQAVLKQGLKDEFGGEVLGLLVDRYGNLIGDETLQNQMRQAATQIQLDTLRKMIEGRRVWVVAAKRYKAEAVHALLRGRLANALVIDSEIARHILSA